MSPNFSSADNHGPPAVLRARIVVPASHPPIEDGAVVVSGNRIVSVGRWRDLSRAARSHVTDLGARALLPGLVNAHSHLDYTRMAGHNSPTPQFTRRPQLLTTPQGGRGHFQIAPTMAQRAPKLPPTRPT